MDAYEQAYETFRNKRMKPRGFKMENQDNVTTDNINTEKLTQTLETYEQAAALYKEDKRDEALELIRTNLGDAAADEAASAMDEADVLNGRVADPQGVAVEEVAVEAAE